MGQNSTEVAYSFGQMGSVFTNLAKPVFPPKDHVIVAIQFLADNTPTAMLTETLDTFGPQFPGTRDTEATDANYLGVCESAVDSAGSTAGVVTIVANAKIKKGQFIIVGADGDSIDGGITLDTSHGHLDPVYQGPNAQGLVVKEISGTSLTIANANGSVFDASSLANDNTLYFLDEYHGAGGTTTEGVKFPKGCTVYGRWIKVVPEADADGGVICYFGK
tara:strand:- start:2279 stop:2935 length:657 start_codon:yes stop_codon:yes gene_type:complete